MLAPLSNAGTTTNWALACITSTLKDVYMKTKSTLFAATSTATSIGLHGTGTPSSSEYNKENHGEANVDPAADADSCDDDSDDVEDGGENGDKDANVDVDAGVQNGANVCGGASESAPSGDTTGYCNFVSDNMSSDSPWILSEARFCQNGWATFLKEHQEAELSMAQLN